MIRSFSHKGLERFFYDGITHWLQPNHIQKISDILDQLDAAGAPSDMNFPGSSLHPLKGARKGFWAVRVSGNWRIIFRFIEGDAFDVDYLDYH